MQITLRVTSVTLGRFGGCVFGGIRVDRKSKKIYLCKARQGVCARVPCIGEIWKVKGCETAHEEFKTFILIEYCSIVSIITTCNEDLLKWHLKKHHVFRGFGLGSKKIERLVTNVGAEKLIELLNNGDWVRLSNTLGERVARVLVNKWGSLKNDFETTQFLTENKIPLSICKKLLRVCCIDTVERIKANPYSLVSFCDIVPDIWSLVENIAVSLNIHKDDERRLVGMIEVNLYQRLNRGHTGISQLELKQYLMADCKENALVDKAIQTALSIKAICFKDINDKRFYQLTSIGYIEFEVERALKKLMSKPPQINLFDGPHSELTKKLERYNIEFCKRNGYPLTVTQLNAIQTSLTNNLTVIDGYSGTGKTTILQAVVDLSDGDREPYIVALSGKAKERAKESTGSDTYTIHNFINRLHNRKVSKYRKMFIIIDEASMVDILLIRKLLGALEGSDYKLMMLGDKAQLPPVGFGLCFHRLVDIGNTDTLKVIKLIEVHRTKSTGMLHHVAMGIRKGKLPPLKAWSGDNEGVFILPCHTKAELHQVLLNTIKKRPEAQIVTPHVTEKRIDSVKDINSFIQRNLRDYCGNKTPYISIGQTRLMKGDPVLVTQNMYELDLYNGTKGVIDSVYYSQDSEELSCDINFGDRGTVKITQSIASTLGLELAYGISVHKSQGSEYDTTIVCAIESSPLLDRSLFYTALTRSKKLTLIAGRYEVASYAVEKGNRSSMLDVIFSI